MESCCNNDSMFDYNEHCEDISILSEEEGHTSDSVSFLWKTTFSHSIRSLLNFNKNGRAVIRNAFLNYNKKGDNVVIDEEMCDGVTTDTFNMLPINVKLYIFSYLNVEDICRSALVCRHWQDLASDQLLWKAKLHQDMMTWGVIGHLSNPLTLQGALTTKEIYIRCCPSINDQPNPASLVSMLKSWMPGRHHVPKIVLFGPGLESDTSIIVRKFISASDESLKFQGFVPGLCQGLGSGLSMKMGELEFVVIVLYSNTSNVRRGNVATNRDENNRLISVHDESQSCDLGRAELNPGFRELVQLVDGFAYIVQSTDNPNIVCDGVNELYAMTDPKWTPTRCPLLVLATICKEELTRLSCLTIAEMLKLRQLNRVWQVQDVCLDPIQGLIEGLKWLSEASTTPA